MKRFLIALACLIGYYLLCRVVFIVWNHHLFAFRGFAEYFTIFWWGFRMDLAAIALLNLPVFVLYVLRLPGRIVFVVLNGLGMALNLLDAGYYPFCKHRCNLDLWYVAGDSAGSFGSVLRIYFPLVLLFLLAVWLLSLLSGWLFVAPPPERRRRGWAVAVGVFLLLLFCVRGWGARPLTPSAPLLDLDPDKLPLAQNSVVTMGYSLLKQEHQLAPRNYFAPAELDSLVTTRHFLGGQGDGGVGKKNVVLFILESFSRCYVMPGDRHKAHTPFFDSLIGKSLFFPHAFANGFESNQGIVAILGGLPSLTDEPLFYSSYANTPLRSLGNILQEKGYSTNFFMGAGRDHFGFGKFARMAGLEDSYWQNDFNDDRFYDGNWGIFDEPFLQYGVKVLSSKPQPFFATFFTISAHPPHTIPPAYRERFELAGQTPAQRSIAYTDYAIQQFFATSRTMPWFKNTLFVFCADHWLAPDDSTRFSYGDRWAIPIFIYDPAQDSGRRSPVVAGQVDIAPTVLDLLHYRGAYSGFGRSLLDTTIAATDRYVVNRIGGGYQLITDQYLYGYDPDSDRGLYLYRYSTDSACTRNLVKVDSLAPVRKRMETLLKANLQRYCLALTNRRLD